jgi:hypothetical protein
MTEQALTPRQRYEALAEKIKSLGFGEHIDPSVDAENVYPCESPRPEGRGFQFLRRVQAPRLYGLGA